jgi:hypothetical protein
MDPSRAVRSEVALGTNCSGDGAEETDGGGGGEISIKPDNIKVHKLKLIPFKFLLQKVISVYEYVCFKKCDKHLFMHTVHHTAKT